MKTILVIDDEPDLRESICEVLSFEGYTTIDADNGKTGLKAMQTTTPDLILCDIMMPEMNGIEFYKKIRKQEESREIPFIFISACSDGLEQHGPFPTNDFHVLPKPFHIGKLITKVNLVFEGKAGMSGTGN
jgi:CheY-like chemotaxis protein